MEFSFPWTEEFYRFGHKLKCLQFNNKAQLAFLEDLYVLVGDGIPPNRAIDMMSKVTSGVSREAALSMGKKISEGQGLADGMKEWFGTNIVEIIRVGEEGGALAATIKSAINSLAQQSGILGALLTAITYPILVITIACSIIVYLNKSVFIQFRAIKPVEQWPPAGQTLVAVANTVESWWWLFVLVTLVFCLILRRLFTHYTGELRPFLDNIPPFSLYRRLTAARFMETLGLLVSNGVVFKNALKVMQYQATPYLVSHLLLMEHLLSMGKGNVADVLSTGLIDHKDILRLRVMAEVKGFEHGLVRMGVTGAENTTATLRFVAKIVGGILLGVGASLILIIIRGIYLTGMSMG